MVAASAPPDFRLYQSNSLEVLAGLLADALRVPAPGQSLLEPDIVLIPQAAMRRWLQASLAQAHGIAANLEFLTPGEFVGRALARNLGPAEGELDAATLHWHLHAALGDGDLLARPAMRAIAAHVAGDDPLRAWTLAGELAAVFEKYQAWRRDWLLRWEAGADADDPQAILWRRVAHGRAHRARRIQAYLDRFEAAHGPRPEGLPARLCAFATLNVSPDVLRVVATQARVGTLHCYVPSPVRDYWGDLQRLRAGDAGRDDADRDNPLLQAWGAAGTDFMRVIGGYELVHASADIDAHADPADGGGALQGSLLRRLQSDLYHRRAAPGFALRDAVDQQDPSLQFHASHTRLRELQVLHDQLRALFDDARFDPPLQPRDVAVLAPDIDPYLPYLEAVFGSRGQPGAIPYALADASPLAGEPLAEVFLRLLALPVSRFGLAEVLDLLASPPLAEAAGLDARALERLHGWLSEAGARWGIDAAHRARLDAPADDAFTWTFALDRLLLGHASGSDALVASAAGEPVAPLPDLEGGALQALDTLVSLLRVLARHARMLGEAMPPQAWRERLLGLLDALFPRPPSNAASQRALDRLRSLVDAFAADARRAGYEAPVPAEAVRAHFGGVLAEADTRAPLLTGGVSVGRMVPMRLLPFRVTCVLGLNDGDYPRRDLVGGLNRLTSELGTVSRRPGDRSTRDDDRFLFLQLFAAAQDVFYASWHGADPRDGSPREPSVLVSELLAAADAQHVPEADAAARLVVRHPLQPFAAAAFGSADEPRRFSYHRQWHEAARHATARRTPPPPWFGGGPLAADEAAGDALSLDDLRRFLLDPAGVFLAQRLQLRTDAIDARGSDTEPLVAPGRGLARSRLQRAMFEAMLRGEDDAAIHAALRARAMVPSGAAGQRAVAGMGRQLAPYVDAFARWRCDATAVSVPLEVDLDGLRLHGRVAEVYPQGIARLRFDAPNGASMIRDGLDWLLARAAGQDVTLVQFHEGDDGIGAYPRDPLSPALARKALLRLVALRAGGLREPLPFGPYSGWAFFNAPDYDRGVQEAAKKWRGGGRGGFAEGEGDAVRLALRGRDPFADGATLLRFADTSMAIFGAVCQGVVHAALDATAFPGLAYAGDDDPQDGPGGGA